MSISAGLDIELYHDFPVWNLISILLNNGWSIFRDGYVSYIPTNDDVYHYEKLTLEQLKNVIQEEERLDKHIGIILMWEDTDIGVDFISTDRKSFFLGAGINRVEMPDMPGYRITNMNWYIERVLPALHRGNVPIEKFSFYQNYSG